jgi:predicted AAA+ superfamily ATPase
MIPRPKLQTMIQSRLGQFPVVALLGPRQVGKTTLARDRAQRAKDNGHQVHHFDLEDPTDLARLANPKLSLEPLTGLVIIDEIQRRPDLFPVLRVLADRTRAATQFLILGSASRDLIQQSSESLAGRIAYIEVPPFEVGENSEVSWQKLWARGGFPKSYLAATDQESSVWREEYIRTFLERDIPQLGIKVPAQHLRRFWMMLAHYHGQIANYSDIARSLDMSDNTIKRYLDILASTFMVRLLQPWHENIGKRQVKSPKIYIRDSGILHSLLRITSLSDLDVHPKLGASWEGFALEEILKVHSPRDDQQFFWAVHQQAELDLLLFLKGKPVGFEFKYTDSPKLSSSMLQSKEVLGLKQLFVVYPGVIRFPLEQGIEAVGLLDALADIKLSSTEF